MITSLLPLIIHKLGDNYKMLKKLILILSLLTLTACTNTDEIKETAQPQEPVEEVVTQFETIEEETIKTTTDDIETIFNTIISSPREVGTQGELDARDYLQSQLDLIGFDTEIQEFNVYEGASTNSNDFFDTNPLNSEIFVKGYNIIAEKDFDPNKKTIVFSAHYDTTTDSIGAADNGAGVTALLEASKKIAEFTDILDYNIRVIFFSGEESFMVGSRSYLNALTQDEIDNIIANLNIDLTSTTKWRKFLFSGQETDFSNELLRINNEFELIPLGGSDHIPFFRKSIMAVSLATFNPLDETFDSDTIFTKETENIYVDIELIKTDADIIFEFMKSININ